MTPDQLLAENRILKEDIRELRRQIKALEGTLSYHDVLDKMRKHPNGFGLTYADIMDLLGANAALLARCYKVT